MQTQFTIPVSKAGRNFEVDFAKLPENAKEYVLEYGLRQVLNDAVSAGDNPNDKKIERTAEAKAKIAKENAATVEAKLKALLDGTVRMTRGSSVDPVEKEAKRIALDAVQNGPKFKAWLAAEKIKLSGNEREADNAKARAELWDRVKVVMATEAVQRLAKENVERAAKLGDLDV